MTQKTAVPTEQIQSSPLAVPDANYHDIIRRLQKMQDNLGNAKWDCTFKTGAFIRLKNEAVNSMNTDVEFMRELDFRRKELEKAIKNHDDLVIKLNVIREELAAHPVSVRQRQRDEAR
ncbi:MAG TPA: hypothetical protein PK514_14730 [Spirochaetota bacterium]|nr:hypothetical protein [Spirochaetota bacterium]